jgi:hypothetical protein
MLLRNGLSSFLLLLVLPTSVMTRWAIVIYHHRTSTGWIVSIMGCESTTRSRKLHTIKQGRGIRIVAMLTRLVERFDPLVVAMQLP